MAIKRTTARGAASGMPHPERVDPELLRLDNRRANRSLVVALLAIVAFFAALGLHRPWVAAAMIPLICGCLMLHRHHADKAWEQINAYYGEDEAE
jgi:hypothetical protein